MLGFRRLKNLVLYFFNAVLYFRRSGKFNVAFLRKCSIMIFIKRPLDETVRLRIVEIDITNFFYSCAPMDFSASVLEVGADAGTVTWRAALEEARITTLLRTDEEKEVFRNFISAFGAWSDEEIASWNDDELNALCIQFVAGDMREPVGFELSKDTTDEEWREYERQIEKGLVSGRLFRVGDRVFFYIGN